MKKVLLAILICGLTTIATVSAKDELRIPITSSQEDYILIPDNSDWDISNKNFTMDYCIEKPLTPTTNTVYNITVMRHGNGLQSFVRDVQIRKTAP